MLTFSQAISTLQVNIAQSFVILPHIIVYNMTHFIILPVAKNATINFVLATPVIDYLHKYAFGAEIVVALLIGVGLSLSAWSSYWCVNQIRLHYYRYFVTTLLLAA